MEGRGVCGRDLGVADSGAGGHQVDLSGQDETGMSTGVDVFDGPGEEPAHGLEAGVRVRGYVHSARSRDIIGPVMVDEAPGADERALTLREGPAHGHRPGPAQGDAPGSDDLDGRPAALSALRSGQAAGAAHHLVRVCFDVAQSSLPLTAASPRRRCMDNTGGGSDVLFHVLYVSLARPAVASADGEEVVAVLLQPLGEQRTDRHHSEPAVAALLERMRDEDLRQAASGESAVDLRVIHDPLGPRTNKVVGSSGHLPGIVRDHECRVLLVVVDAHLGAGGILHCLRHVPASSIGFTSIVHSTGATSHPLQCTHCASVLSARHRVYPHRLHICSRLTTKQVLDQYGGHMAVIRPTLHVLSALRKANLLAQNDVEAYDSALRVDDISTKVDRLAALELDTLDVSLFNDARSLLTVDKLPDTHRASTSAAQQNIYELRDHTGAAWRGAGFLDQARQILWVIHALPHDHFHSEAPEYMKQLRKAGRLGPSTLDLKILQAEHARLDRKIHRVSVLSALVDALQQSISHRGSSRVVMPETVDFVGAEMWAEVSDIPDDPTEWAPRQAHTQIEMVSIEIFLADISPDVRRWLLHVCLPFLQPDRDMIESVFRKSQSVLIMVTQAKLMQLLSLNGTALANFTPPTPPEPTHLHYTAKAGLTTAYVEGSAVRAVCGDWWIPSGDENTHSELPICEKCESEHPFAEAISHLWKQGATPPL